MPRPAPPDSTRPQLPVPLAVWPTVTPTRPGQISPSAAARLLATFSRPDDLVVVIDGPAVLHDAAGYLHRRSVAVHRTDPDTRGPASSGRAGMIVDHRTARPTGDDLLAEFTRHADSLRPGGILVTVHTPDAGPTDALAADIAAACGAGLRYLQHIVLLTAPITGGQVHPGPYAGAPTGGLVVTAHTNLAVFTTPENS